MSAEEFVSNLLGKYPPGSYLLGEKWADEIAEMYMKMDKERFMGMLRHDYAVALLKRDKSGLGRIREAYRQLASWFDWGEPPWINIEKAVGEKLDLNAAADGVMKLAEEASNVLFALYREEMAVDGWRNRPDETVWDGLSRGLLADDEDAPFNVEYKRWVELELRLKKVVWDERLRSEDRVALWFARKLLSHVRAYLYSKEHTARMEGLWLNRILKGIISGSFDVWADLTFLYIDAAFMEINDKLRLKIRGPYLVEDLLIMAAMAAEGNDPRGRSLKDLEAYLEGFAERVGDEELVDLYRKAKTGAGGVNIFKTAFLGWDELTDEEKKAYEEMEEASNDFIVFILQYIAEILKKRGVL